VCAVCASPDGFTRSVVPTTKVGALSWCSHCKAGSDFVLEGDCVYFKFVLVSLGSRYVLLGCGIWEFILRIWEFGVIAQDVGLRGIDP
jgi:hypothetical protein